VGDRDEIMHAGGLTSGQFDEVHQRGRPVRLPLVVACELVEVDSNVGVVFDGQPMVPGRTSLNAVERQARAPDSDADRLFSADPDVDVAVAVGQRCVHELAQSGELDPGAREAKGLDVIEMRAVHKQVADDLD
jgi:hypothetical protein